jgi:carbonic anhydrase/acetyltransferase-like protein (isoleucine patch superfamily)
MIIKHRGFEPIIDSSALIVPTAVVIGNVKVGPHSRIMYGAVLDSEGSSIEIGECTIVCENAVVRATLFGDVEHKVVIGDNTFVSPHATLLGCTIEQCCYIATGASVLQGATIQAGAVVAVGALVHAGTVIPKEFFIPPYNIAIGNSVKLYSPDERDALSSAIKSVGFSKIAFGVEAKWEDRISRYRQVAEVRSKEFENHFNDIIIVRKDA